MTDGGAGPPTLLARVEAALVRPVDIAWLAAFRALFGLTLCVSMLRFIAYGWIDDFFVRPRFHFKYWGFGWVEPLAPQGMHALFWALAALSLCVAAGFCFRIAALLFFAGFAYLQLIDVATYLNHYYLAALLALLLALSPAHRAYSVDAFLFGGAQDTVRAGWLYLFRVQVGIVYTFAGVAKAHADWLLDGQPLKIWLGSHSDFPVLGRFFTQAPTALAMSWAGFLFDSTIALWLSFRKTRPFAYAAVIAFHAMTRALFPIGMFPVIMVLAALVFFSPSWPRRLFGRWMSAFEAPAPSAFSPSRRQRAALALGALYCAAQLLVPLRFLAYGGNVRWHEQGMRFSWRVMVREKNGSITFVVRQKQTGRIWHVNPERYLTRVQAREMSGQPDLILQLAHRIEHDFAAQGRGPVEVRVDALVSLNGREIRRLIDPDVDLTTIDDGLGKATWILPAPSGPPPGAGRS